MTGGIHHLSVLAATAAVALIAAIAMPGASAQVAQPVSVPNLTQPAAAPETLSLGEKPHPDYDPLGIRLGSFMLRPSLDLAEQYDGNIYGSNSVIRSDAITLLTPALDLTSNWNNEAVGLHAEGDIAKHARYTADDTNNAIVQLDGRLDIFHDQVLSLSAGYQALHEDRSSPDSIAAAEQVGGGSFGRYPTPFDVATGRLAYVYAPSRLGLEFDADFNGYSFANVPANNGRLEINSDQNREEYTFGPKISYTIDPDYTVFFQFEGDVRSYDTTRDASPFHYKRSSSGYDAVAGSEFDIDRLITGQFYIGWQDQNYADPRLSAISGLRFGGSVLWNVTQLTSIRVQASRDVEETIIIGSSGLLDTTAQVSVEHELFRNILVTLGVSYDNANYQGALKQVDNSVGLNGSVRWLLNSNLSVGLTVDYTTRSSSVMIDRFDRDQVGIDIKGQF
jgi:hypothetical protein